MNNARRILVNWGHKQMRTFDLGTGMYRASEWVMKLAYINLLWILFTLMGLVIFGIVPATIAIFAITRKWIRGEKDTLILSTFLKAYKHDFLKGNIICLAFIIICIIIYCDWLFITNLNGISYEIAMIVLVMIGIIVISTLLYFFPVYVHFDIKFTQYFKYAFLMVVSYPLITFLLLIGVFAVYNLMYFIPGLIPFFGFSILAIVINWIVNQGFLRNEIRKREII